MTKEGGGSAETITERLLDEGVLSITQAAAAEGITISTKTALRWCLHGVRGTRLESLKVGGRRLTSRKAIRRFVASTQEGQPSPRQGGFTRSEADLILRGFGLGRSAIDPPWQSLEQP